MYILKAKGIHEFIIIHSDNQGTMGLMNKGCSPNMYINLSIHQMYTILCPNFIMLDLIYIPSKTNSADPLSCGVLGLLHNRLSLSFKLPEELHSIFENAN